MKKILVIDYDQASLAVLHKTLSQEGFDVVLAGDGQAGWEKFQSEKPDLVLMEAMLSKIHGFELCDRITKDPVRKVPVFIMTGVYKDRVYRTEALRTYGASEYFEKPLDMLKFVASIHAVLTVPDIKPEPEPQPGNGRTPDGSEPLPVIKSSKEESRRVEPPPEVRPAREEAPRTRPVPDAGWTGVDGLGLESALNITPAKEEHRRPEPAPEIRLPKDILPKTKTVPDSKHRKDEEIRLETLLDIMPEKETRRRPEPSKPAPSPFTVPKRRDEKPQEAAKKEHASQDIDQLLKTTLADFGLETEKKKVPKVIVPPAAPVPVPEKIKAAPPVATMPERPKPVPPPAPERPKPVPPPTPPPVPHVAPQEKPRAAMPPAMPAAVVEKPKAPQPPPPAPQAQPPARPKPVAQPVQTAPVTPKPKAEPKPEPKSKAVRVETKPQTRPHEPQKTAETKMFKDIYEVEKKKSPVPFIAVGAGLVIVAAVGFFILRPKHAANPAGPASNPPTTLTQSSVPEKTQDTSVPSLSEEKLRAVSPKPKAVAPQNQNRQAELLPTAEEAIVPPQTMDISRMTVQKPTEKKQDAKTAEQKPVELKPTDTKTQENKTEEAKTAETQASQAQGQPPVKTETSPPQGSTANTDNAGAPPAPVVWAKTGDLVDLAAVDEPPKILKTFEPAYPLHAKQFGKEGQITVNALINEAGNVIETGILKGLKDDMGLEKAAADAVRKWKFQPAKKDGVNVKVWRPVIITFKAGGTKIP